MRFYNYLNEIFKSTIDYKKTVNSSDEIEVEFEYMDRTFNVIFEMKNFEEMYKGSDIDDDVKRELGVEEIGDI